MNRPRRVAAIVGGSLVVGLAGMIAGLAGCETAAVEGGGGASAGRSQALAKYQRALNLRVDLIPKGWYGRKWHRPMRPRYITVHSTQSYSAGANAAMHARALRNGNLKASNNLLGYLTWHFTVDEGSVYQSMPTNERGEHADYEGAGNRQSVGIEMCENRGNSRAATVERTAKLVAVLMAEHNIPLSNVVPHYHWERIQPKTGRNIGHKNCPHFLMDDGRPGKKWQGFLAKVDGYQRKVKSGSL